MSTAILEQQQQSIVSDAMQQYGYTQTVCSYHFMPLKFTRRFKSSREGGFLTPYKWNACKSLEGPPEIELVRDGFQKLFTGTDPFSKKKNYVDEPWAAIHIARDLVKAVTGMRETSPGHDGPAFWISKASVIPQRSELVLWGTPQFMAKYHEFVEECEAYKTRAYRFAERMVGQADSYHANGDPVSITDLHRSAGLMIGVNEAEHPWIRSTKHGAMIECPFCGKPTSSKAPKCGSCHEIVDKALYETILQRIDRSAAPMEMPLPPPVAPPQAVV